MNDLLKAALVGAACLASVPPAAAAEPAHPFVTIAKTPGGGYRTVEGYQLGTLSCTAPAAMGIGFTSKRALSCEYRPIAGRHAIDLYMGSFKTIGVDIGATGPGVIAWAVVAHSRDLGPGDLAGKYRGASASVAALIGAGANVLVGGSNATVSLQPLSIEGQTGFSLAAGYSSLTLDPI